jgi:predicted ATP-grasp superfamily ATP-dependent carboligase
VGAKGHGALRILVTDAGTRTALGVIRSLGRAGHTVIAGHREGLDRPPSVSSRYCSTRVCYPDPHRSQALFREWLSDQANRHAMDAVLPVAEASVVGVAAVRNALPSDTIAMVPRDRALHYTLSKFHATRLALASGIPCPATVFISDGNSTQDYGHEMAGLRFPIIIKTDNHFTEEGGYARGRHFVANDAHQARNVLADIKHLQVRVIAQEYIPGTGAGAYLLRFDGKTHLKFAHRRLHEVPHTGGASSLRESCRDEELVRLGEKLLEAIDYVGVAMVEFRRDTRDERRHFLEINGRFWGSLALALHCGVDFPAALVHCYQFGTMPPQSVDYRSGLKCRNVFPGEVHHLFSILKSAGKARPGGPPWSRLRSIGQFLLLFFDPKIRHDYFWWSDPLPGIHQAWEMMRWLGRKIVKYGRRKLRRVGQEAAEVFYPLGGRPKL